MMTNEEEEVNVDTNTVSVLPIPIEYQYWQTAMDMTNEALKKQIPQKPIKKYGMMRCPNCECKMIHHAYIYKRNYCDNCGQRLDWSESND